MTENSSKNPSMTRGQHAELKARVNKLTADLKNPDALNNAIENLNTALANLGCGIPVDAQGLVSPYSGEDRLQPDAGISVFKDESLNWSLGTFLLHDAMLADLPKKKAANVPVSGILRESTPILCVKRASEEDADIGSVHRLLVEKLPHPAKGPIVPDLLHFETAGFPNEQGRGNFVQVMQKALNDARPASDTGRYRWWVEKEPSEHFPAGIQGRSAQVAAACCMLALNDPQKNGHDPLLDERVAVTACLGKIQNRAEDWKVEPDPDDDGKYLTEVAGRTLPEKFAAAANVRLIAVLVCETQKQKPYSPEFHHTVEGEKRTVLIQPVANLAEAYDSLLLTSKAVAEYKLKIFTDWHEKWNPQPTPDDFKDKPQ